MDSFFPVSKAIRIAIGKEEGDSVLVRLFRDGIPNTIPQELIDCLEDDPGKLQLFYQLDEETKKQWIEYIYSANSEDSKASRIVKLLTDLGQKA